MMQTLAPAFGCPGFPTVFREKAHRLYHWADDPAVPAENNLAERDLRPLVIARKISFGSQSVAAPELCKPHLGSVNCPATIKCCFGAAK